MIARWDLLQILYNRLVGDRSRIAFDKRAVQFDQSSSEVKVKCADGSSFAGDVVVGADGIHSVTRREALWHQDLAKTLGRIQNRPLGKLQWFLLDRSLAYSHSRVDIRVFRHLRHLKPYT